jgi:hypothetical protein
VVVRLVHLEDLVKGAHINVITEFGTIVALGWVSRDLGATGRCRRRRRTLLPDGDMIASVCALDWSGLGRDGLGCGAVCWLTMQGRQQA